VIGVAEPLRALMAEIEHQAYANSATQPDLAAVPVRWEVVSDAIRALVRTRIADVQAAESASRSDCSVTRRRHLWCLLLIAAFSC